MKLNYKKIITVLTTVMLFMFTASSLNSSYDINPPSRVDNIITLEYFPVDTSLTLIYNSSMGEAKSTVSMDDESYILDMRNDDFFFIQTINLTGDSVYLTRLDQEVDVFLFITAGVKVTYDTPSLRYPFPLNSGDNWSWTGVECIDDDHRDTIKITGQVLGTEIIETESGSFDCVKFQIDIHKRKGNTRFYEWRTPEIGLVKLEAYLNTNGFIGSIMSLLGYDEMSFILKEII